MKKSLSSILALAMTFSMFSSVALGATSADFNDLKDLDADTKAKFDAMISAGVFNGVAEGEFGLKDEMNRAQFAKVAALIFGLKVDESLKTSSFSDVKADDPANGYALPYIEAVKAAGITDGVAPGQFDPAGKVTKEQLATFLVRGLHKDAEAKATPGVNDSTVSDWAKGYVALALQLKVLENGADGKFGGTTNATRDLLVLSSYEAKQQYKPVSQNGKVGIAKLEATDADKLKVTFNAAVTTADAKIEVKRGDVVVPAGDYKIAWSEKDTVATLTFNTKFQDGTLVVNFSGVSNLDDALKTAQVAVTKERIAKIEFVTASETLPRTTKKLRVEFKATNQYGAKSTLSYNNFTINSGSNVTVSGISGEQAFYLQQNTKSGTGTGNIPAESALERNERVSVTIIHEDSGVTANKVFAIGELPNVAKIEVGELKNSSNTTVETLDALKDVYLDFKAYDQYGIPVEDESELNKGVTFYSSEGNVIKVATDDSGNSVWFTKNEIGTDAADLKFRYNKNEARDSVTLTLIANGSGQTVTKTVKVTAPKTPAAVEFANYTYTLAENDSVAAANNDSDLTKKFYVPIIVKDSKGEVLTAQEIADNAYKFTIYSSGGIQLSNTTVNQNNSTISTPIVQTGEHKGKIAIGSVSSKGSAGITVQLMDTPTVRAQFNTSVGDKRKADKIAFSTAAKKFMVNGTDNEFKLKTYDQHGGELKLDDTNIRVEMKLKANTAIAANGNYGVTVKSNDVANPFGTGAEVSSKLFQFVPTPATAVTREVYAEKFVNGAYTPYQYLNVSEVFDKSFKFFTSGAAADTSYTLTAYLQELKDGQWKEISSASTTLEVLNVNDSKNKLTYEVYIDKGVNNTILAVDDYLNGVTGATYVRTNLPKVTKELKVRAKNSSGDQVQVPNTVQTVTSSNPNVVAVTESKWITGLDAGAAKLNVVYKDAKGDFYTSTIDVTSKNEGPIVASIVASKSGNQINSADIQRDGDGVPTIRLVDRDGVALTPATYVDLYAWDYSLFKKLTIKDQYGNEFISDRAAGTKKDDNGANNSDQFIQQHASILGLTFYASDIKGTGTVTIDSTGKITKLDAGVTSFTLNVIAPSGVTASAAIVVN